MGEYERRVIALDVGDVRIGVAVSDATGTIAQPVEVYRRTGFGPDCKYVLALCERFHTDHLLLGFPLNMNGSHGNQAQKVVAFGQMLEKAGLRVDYQDERMSTMIAEKMLISGHMRREERRQKVDKVAAAVILEHWLASGWK